MCRTDNFLFPEPHERDTHTYSEWNKISISSKYTTKYLFHSSLNSPGQSSHWLDWHSSSGCSDLMSLFQFSGEISMVRSYILYASASRNASRYNGIPYSFLLTTLACLALAVMLGITLMLPMKACPFWSCHVEWMNLVDVDILLNPCTACKCWVFITGLVLHFPASLHTKSTFVYKANFFCMCVYIGCPGCHCSKQAT